MMRYDEKTDLPLDAITQRAKWARELDRTAGEVLLAAEALVSDITLQRDCAYRVDLAFGEKVKAWRVALNGYREAGGLRTDLGGLTPQQAKTLP